jgi:hypothetical protein
VGQKLPEKENELYQRVDEVLHYLWDPIGVSGAPGARDEYYAYLPTTFSLLKNNSNAEEIADYLTKVSSEHMSLGVQRSRDIEIAEILIDWKESLLGG